MRRVQARHKPNTTNYVLFPCQSVILYFSDKTGISWSAKEPPLYFYLFLLVITVKPKDTFLDPETRDGQKKQSLGFRTGLWKAMGDVAMTAHLYIQPMVKTQ